MNSHFLGPIILSEIPIVLMPMDSHFFLGPIILSEICYRTSGYNNINSTDTFSSIYSFCQLLKWGCRACWPWSLKVLNLEAKRITTTLLESLDQIGLFFKRKTWSEGSCPLWWDFNSNYKSTVVLTWHSPRCTSIMGGGGKVFKPSINCQRFNVHPKKGFSYLG